MAVINVATINYLAHQINPDLYSEMSHAPTTSTTVAVNLTGIKFRSKLANEVTGDE